MGAVELGQERTTAKRSSELCTVGGAGVRVYTYVNDYQMVCMWVL